MTLTLELPPEVEGALAAEARRKGTTPESLVLQDLRHRYATQAGPTTPAPREDPTLALFAQWDAEDTTDDPEEIARRNREWEETKTNLEANRFSLEGRTDLSVLLGDGADGGLRDAT